MLNSLRKLVQSTKVQAAKSTKRGHTKSLGPRAGCASYNYLLFMMFVCVVEARLALKNRFCILAILSSVAVGPTSSYLHYNFKVSTILSYCGILGS